MRDLNDDDNMMEDEIVVIDPNPFHQDTVSFEKWVDEEDDTVVTLVLPAMELPGVGEEGNFRGIENIIGSAEDDTLTGNDGIPTSSKVEMATICLSPVMVVSILFPIEVRTGAVDVDLSDAASTSRSSGGHAGGDTIANADQLSVMVSKISSDRPMVTT